MDQKVPGSNPGAPTMEVVATSPELDEQPTCSTAPIRAPIRAQPWGSPRPLLDTYLTGPADLASIRPASETRCVLRFCFFFPHALDAISTRLHTSRRSSSARTHAARRWGLFSPRRLRSGSWIGRATWTPTRPTSSPSASLGTPGEERFPALRPWLRRTVSRPFRT